MSLKYVNLLIRLQILSTQNILVILGYCKEEQVKTFEYRNRLQNIITVSIKCMIDRVIRSESTPKYLQLPLSLPLCRIQYS